MARSNRARNLATGKPHPRPLAAGLTELRLQLGGVRHREARPIEEPDPVPVPGRLGRRRRPDRLGDSLGQAAEHPQGEPLPSGTIGGVGEVPLAEVDDVRTGGVAVKDLEDEQVDGGHGVEHSLPPGVFFLLACLLDGVGGDFVGEVLLETAQDGDDT